MSPHPLAEDFNDLFEHSLSGLLTLDTKGRILQSNRRIAQWLGLEAIQIKDKRFSDLLSVGGKIYYETHLAPLLRMQGNFEEAALELVAADGKRTEVLVNAYERRDEQGKPLFVRLTAYRANERRVYEKNLHTAKIEAENHLSKERETATLRDQFIAVLGHDLRNPLGAMLGGIMILSTGEQSERNCKILGMMKDSGTRMTELIENVMDFARGQLGGGMSLSRRLTSITPVLQHVVDELHSARPNRTIETDFTLTAPVDCDPDRIAQLLSNLLANALTHGAQDQPIKVEASQENSSFQLSVSNQGRPIAPGRLEALFQPFTREDENSHQGGLGLGLYICSEIARAHKGTLSATSDADETRFTFQMPLAM